MVNKKKKRMYLMYLKGKTCVFRKANRDYNFNYFNNFNKKRTRTSSLNKGKHPGRYAQI